MPRKSGPGLGGPYLLPNMHALVYLCEHFNLHDQAIYWRAVLEMDEYQRRRLVEVVTGHNLSFKSKRVAVLGFAYKASTSDSRGSPSVDIVRSLLQEGASVYVYDPRVAAEDVMKAFDCHRDVHVAGANVIWHSFVRGWGCTPSGFLCDNVGRCALHHGCHSTQRFRHRVHRLGGV
jgi:UDPglucose 6-dehydrogenase